MPRPRSKSDRREGEVPHELKIALPKRAAESVALPGKGALPEKLKRLKVFACDVDGILTDGTVTMNGSTESKTFNIRDGLGLKLLQKAGIKVVWISNRPSDATSQRAADLKIDCLWQKSHSSKLESAREIAKRFNVSMDELCYMGDDLVDLALLENAGVAIAVANGSPETHERADYVTRATGGHEAVREAVELILKAQGKWDGLVGELIANG